MVSYRAARPFLNSDHARIVLLSSGGVGNRQIRVMVGCTPQWVRVVIHRFNKGGITSIEWYPDFQIPRRPYKFMADLLEEIVIAAFSPHTNPDWHESVVAGEVAGVLDRTEDHRCDQSRMVAHVPASCGCALASDKNIEFLGFLKWVGRPYAARETLHIVMDNCGPHVKAEVLTWATSHNIKFYLPPTNTSWLNRIESQFTALKNFALEDTNFRTHEEQQGAIARYLTWRTGSRELSMVFWSR